MLFVTLLLVLVGFLLVNAGLRGDGTWRKPWQPVADAIGKKA